MVELFTFSRLMVLAYSVGATPISFLKVLEKVYTLEKPTNVAMSLMEEKSPISNSFALSKRIFLRYLIGATL